MLSLDKQNTWREKYKEQYPTWQPATEQYAELVRTHLFPTAMVLDVGCGRGGLVEQLNVPLNQVVGIDPDWQSLATHRLALPRVQGMSDALPFAPNQFDVVFSSWVMEHLERPFLTLHAIHHCLKPGGVYIFITPNKRHPLAKLNQLFGSLGKLQGMLVEKLYHRADDDTFPTYYRANSDSDLATLCQQVGLHVKQLHFIPDPTYLAFNGGAYQASCWLENSLPANRKIHLVGILQKPA